MTQKNNQHLEDTSKQKISMFLRSSEPELRDFERRLRNIYISHNQLCQMKEKEYRDLRDEIYRKRESEIILAKQIHDAAESKYEIDELEKCKIVYRKELLDQVNNKQEHKAILKDQIKDEMDENERLQKSIQEEQERKKLERINKTCEAQYEMKLFSTVKHLQIKKNQILQICESKRIERVEREQEERLFILEEEKKRKIQIKDSIQNQISSNMLAQKVAQQERLHLIEQLQEHEYNKSQSRNYIEEGAQKDLMRESMRNILKLQIDANVLREKNLKADEDKYRKQLSLEVQILEDDHNIKLIEDERKKSQYAAELKKQIEDDLEKRKRQQTSIRNIDNYVKQYNENIQQQILEEKQRILYEYTSKTCEFSK